MRGCSVRFIVGCITFLGTISIAGGVWLSWKGFHDGQVLISTGGVGAISGLLGMLNNRQGPPPADPPGNPVTP